MKKALMSLLASLILFSTSILYADEDTVLMFIREGSRNLDLMLEEEVLLMKSMLEAEGYKVEIATNDGADLTAGSFSVAVDHKIADISMDDFGAIALPCMAPPPGSVLEETVIQLVRAAAADAKPIAASRGAVGYLAEAGVLQGREYAYASAVSVEERPSFRGGSFTGTGTTRDGFVSTNGICPLASRGLNLPDGTTNWTQAFIDSLKERG